MATILECLKITPGQATEAYIKLRDKKKERDEAHKESLKPLVQMMDQIEAGLLEFINASGANSFASDAGTAYKSEQVSATIEDKEAFRNFVVETQQWDALDWKANKGFVKDYLEENEESPPGLKISKINTIGVQRS